MSLRIPAEDDRGMPVELHPELARLPPRMFLWWRKDPQDPVRTAWKRFRPGWDVLPGAVLTFAGFLLFDFTRGAIPAGVRVAGFAGWLLLILWFVDPIFRRRRLRARWRSVLPVFTDRALCPSCGHSLRDLVPADDGCVMCPECGAAWNHERIGRDPTP
jgi:hypothetical protein